MSITRFIVGIISVGLIMLSGGVVYGQATSTGSGQAYPSKSIRIFTSNIGGGSDFVSRLVAQGITGPLGQPVIVEFSDIEPVGPHIKSGRLRALAVSSVQPSALFPGLPTIAATVPGYVAITSTGVFAPAGTPQAIINRLNQEIVRVVKTPEAREQFFRNGSEVVASSPEELAAWMKTDMALWGKVIKEAGIKAD